MLDTLQPFPMSPLQPNALLKGSPHPSVLCSKTGVLLSLLFLLALQDRFQFPGGTFLYLHVEAHGAVSFWQNPPSQKPQALRPASQGNTASNLTIKTTTCDTDINVNTDPTAPAITRCGVSFFYR